MEIVERIKADTFTLFMKYGLRSVTMDDIAAKLGISKKTIYNYYADKDALVDAVVLDEMINNKHQCDVDRDLAQNAIHEIFLAMEMMQKTLGEMNPVLLYDLQKYYPTSHKKFEVFKNEYLYNVILQNIKRGKNEGLYRMEIDETIIAKLRVETMMMAFNQDFMLAHKYTMMQLEHQLLMHFLYGVATAKGIKLITKYQAKPLL